MSQSQGCSVDLAQAYSWTSEKCCEAANTVVPQILESFRSTFHSQEDVLFAVNVLAEKFLAFMFGQELGKEIIKTVFFQLLDSFDDALSRLPGVHIELSSCTPSTVVTSLQDVIKIVQCTENFTNQIISLVSSKNVELKSEDVPSMPQITIKILKKSYSHCKSSEKNYATLFQSASGALSNLFQKTYSLQKTLSFVLSKFKSSHLEGIEEKASAQEYIVQICEGLTDICRIISGLDDTLLCASWKLLLWFVLEFKLVLRKSITISTCVTLLCGNILESVMYTVQLCSRSSHLLASGDISTKRACLRSCQHAHFYLTALASTFAEYGDLFSDSTVMTIVNFICDLFMALKPRLQVIGDDDGDLIDVETQFYCRILPEIDKTFVHLIQNPSFVRLYHRSGCRGEENQPPFGWLMFQLKLCRALLQNTDLAVSWFEKNCGNLTTHNTIYQGDLLPWIFQATVQAQEDVSIFLKVPNKNGVLVTCVLYDIIIVDCCSWIVSQTRFKFFTEKFLVENLFDHDPWKTLLSVDILAFLCKYSQRLSVHYFGMLFQMLKDIPAEIPSVLPFPLQQVLALMKRIFLNIDKPQQKQVCSEIIRYGWSAAFDGSSKVDSTCPVALKSCKVLSEKMNSWVNGNHQFRELVELTSLFQQFTNSRSMPEMLKKRSLQAGEVCAGFDDFAKSITKVWHCLTRINTDHYDLILCKRFIVLLIKITSNWISVVPVIEVLEVLALIMEKYIPLSLKMAVVEFLAILDIENFVEKCEVVLSGVLMSLISDPHWRARHAALNAFEVVSRKSSGALLEGCVQSPGVSLSIESHLRQTTNSLPDLGSISDLREKFLNKSPDNCYGLLGAAHESKICSEFEHVVGDLKDAVDSMDKLVDRKMAAGTTFNDYFVRNVEYSKSTLEVILSKIDALHGK